MICQLQVCNATMHVPHSNSPTIRSTFFTNLSYFGVSLVSFSIVEGERSTESALTGERKTKKKLASAFKAPASSVAPNFSALLVKENFHLETDSRRTVEEFACLSPESLKIKEGHPRMSMIQSEGFVTPCLSLFLGRIDLVRKTSDF
ncbi:uncharacterized protein EAF01_003364 [Botrytis porri]|uniref:uncharacterized protein n=1 Tax=Botrytis porri TaxID=87229 RepID=UPI0018FF6BDB|nr:uncharacterized protein EAF01_003364 [Botrytis porri]KAF7909646.1 hypothetical protein EAF01_003364 [Botrytis porri]